MAGKSNERRIGKQLKKKSYDCRRVGCDATFAKSCNRDRHERISCQMDGVIVKAKKHLTLKCACGKEFKRPYHLRRHRVFSCMLKKKKEEKESPDFTDSETESGIPDDVHHVVEMLCGVDDVVLGSPEPIEQPSLEGLISIPLVISE